MLIRAETAEGTREEGAAGERQGERERARKKGETEGIGGRGGGGGGEEKEAAGGGGGGWSCEGKR